MISGLNLKVVAGVLAAIALAAGAAAVTRWYYKSELSEAEVRIATLRTNVEKLEGVVERQNRTLDNLQEQNEADQKSLRESIQRERAFRAQVRELNEKLDEISATDQAHYNAEVPASEWDLIFAPLRHR